MRYGGFVVILQPKYWEGLFSFLMSGNVFPTYIIKVYQCKELEYL